MSERIYVFTGLEVGREFCTIRVVAGDVSTAEEKAESILIETATDMYGNIRESEWEVELDMIEVDAIGSETA